MADGINTLANLPGKTDSSYALLVVSQPVSGTPGPTRGTPIANLPCKTDSSYRLVVTFG